MKRIKYILLAIILLSLNASVIANTQTIDQKTEGMKKYEGYFTFYWDNSSGKIWLEIDKFDTEVLYLNSVSSGLSVNGIDRNGLGQTKIVKFVRIGPKVLMIQPNYSYRAETDDEFVIDAVETGFGRSVIWGFNIAAQQDSRILVDATKFLIRDARNWGKRLGNYRLDESKSAFELSKTKNFPNNAEFDVMLTFTGSGFRGREAPSSEAITVNLHHSFVKLPDGDYEPRKYDPRSSFMSMSYNDYATPIDDNLKKEFILRHRIKKKNPNAKVSEAVEPIIYYIDRGVPAEIMDAVVEGAKWWNTAWTAAGYKNAFQVKLLPKGADPMDIRYNMVNWMNRSSRGWSYGSSVSDPRTGEIIKGNVSMGALRIRQVYLMAKGLIGEYVEGNKITEELKEVALQRIRQLTAHEIGHTIGLVHNYASNANDRSSVMDYPHALAKINNDGSIDFSEAYTNDIGEWDKIAIAYGYQDYPEGVDQNEASKEVLDKAFENGIYYLSDRDAGINIHPLAHQWDNGKHPVDELERVMKIRKIALDNFSEKKIKFGKPMSTLEDILVPIYFYHRYQIHGSAAVLGGLYYNHALRGGPQYVQKYVPAEEQRRALSVLLTTIKPEHLIIDERILKLIPPRAPGHYQTNDLFQGYTGGIFDPLAAAKNIADMTVGKILNPARAARLIQFNALDEKFPGLNEVIEKLISSTFKSDVTSSYKSEIQRIVNISVLEHLMNLISNENSSSQVKAISLSQLFKLNNYLGKGMKDQKQKAHFSYCSFRIEQFLKEPHLIKMPKEVKIPNGAPIG